MKHRPACLRQLSLLARPVDTAGEYCLWRLVFVCLFVSNITGQEAQLSQRDRAMLRVTEYFAKSLKVTQGR